MPRRKPGEEPTIGDNGPDIMTASAQSRLKSFAGRVMRLNEDADEIASDIKEVFAEAKGEGFDVKILRKVIKILEADKAKYQEEQALIELYLHAVGYGDLI